MLQEITWLIKNSTTIMTYLEHVVYVNEFFESLFIIYREIRASNRELGRQPSVVVWRVKRNKVICNSHWSFGSSIFSTYSRLLLYCTKDNKLYCRNYVIRVRWLTYKLKIGNNHLVYSRRQFILLETPVIMGSFLRKTCPNTP